MDALRRRLAVARGDEPADLVVRGGRVLSSFTREWLQVDVAIADGVVAGLGEYEGRETLEADGRWRGPRLHRRAHAHRVGEAARGRARPPRAAVRHDRGRRRSARDRERARGRRRSLAPRRVVVAAARGVLHGAVLRTGLTVRVAEAAARPRRPRGPDAPTPRARARRDDELPGRDRRRTLGAREARAGGRRTRRRPCAGGRRSGAAGVRGGRDRIGS